MIIAGQSSSAHPLVPFGKTTSLIHPSSLPSYPRRFVRDFSWPARVLLVMLRRASH